jgi:ATP-binding cassette, subfamily B (MDR/TAP), member 1
VLINYNITGGQRQRIAIARSIISRPKILILDEATSAIDVHGERIVQHALERASRGRTTIMIAHRLSTIKKADHIVVIQSGRIVEQGTHGNLLSNESGVYSSLVHSQQLGLGDGGEDCELEEENITAILQREKSAAEPETDSAVHEGAKVKSFNRAAGVGRLLYEQRGKWPIYIVAVVAAVAVAAAMPVQAYLFARVIVVFQETRALFVDDSRFWSLMWLILAIAVGISYFVLGFSTTQVEHRVGATYRQEYFESILGQKIAYFDEEDHATGTLTSQALGDPKKFQELLGVQGAQAYIGVFNLLGGVSK